MSKPAPERRPWSAREVGLLGLALLPPAFLLRAILSLGVDTPYMDQWETASLFVRHGDGTLSFADLWALQNESRMFFPRLVFLGLGLLTGWNAVAEMLPAFLLAAFESWAIFRLDRRHLGGTRSSALGRLVLANLLLFGPIQYENWFWGHQVVVFVPPACLLGGLLVAGSGLGVRAKSILAGLLCFVATFSFANGMLLWPLLAAAVLSFAPGDPAARRRRAAIWAAAAIAAVALYMAGYEKPAAQPGFAEALRSPGDSGRYLLVLLGSPLGQGLGHTGLAASTAFGVAAGILFVALVWFALRGGLDPEMAGRIHPWVFLAAYAFGTALVTTAGRVGFGVPHALSPRYATFAVLFTVALVYLVAAILPEAARRRAFGLDETRAPAVAASLATVAVFAHLLASSSGMLRAENWRVRRLEARACLAFLEIAPNEPFLAVNAYPFLEKLRERAAAVDRLGMLRPALVKPDALAALLGAEADPASGSFNTATPAGDAVRCAGRAFLPDRGEPPDAILVGTLDAGGAPRLLAVAQATKIRLSSLEPPSADFRRTTDWECRLPLAAIPGDVRTLRAWAYDAESGRARLLPGHPAVPGR